MDHPENQPEDPHPNQPFLSTWLTTEFDLYAKGDVYEIYKGIVHGAIKIVCYSGFVTTFCAVFVDQSPMVVSSLLYYISLVVLLERLPNFYKTCGLFMVAWCTNAEMQLFDGNISVVDNNLNNYNSTLPVYHTLVMLLSCVNWKRKTLFYVVIRCVRLVPLYLHHGALSPMYLQVFMTMLAWVAIINYGVELYYVQLAKNFRLSHSREQRWFSVLNEVPEHVVIFNLESGETEYANKHFDNEFCEGSSDPAVRATAVKKIRHLSIT